MLVFAHEVMRNTAPAAQYAPEAYATPGAAENFDVIKGDDDLPF